MAFYAYCLLRLNSDEPWPVIQGIDNHPVFPLRCGKYTMLLSRLERTFPFTPRSLVEHGQVITRVFESHTVLPMRFATFFQSEKQITDLIQENQKELLEAFCHLRGKAEMRLKFFFQMETQQLETDRHERKPPQRTLGMGDFDSNNAGDPVDSKNRELQQLAVRVCGMFRPLEQQMFCRLVHRQELLVDCAHLIESCRVETYQKLYSLASEQVKNCDFRISGPWPPYHFLPSSVRLPAGRSPIPMRRRVSIGAR